MLNILITGANRGVGQELTKQYLAQGHKVIAAVRTPSKVEPRPGLIVVKLDSTSNTDAARAIQELQGTHNITRLDIVIANAAVSPSKASLEDVKAEDMEIAWRTNVLAPTLLFQAVLPLLDRATSKFVIMGSEVGTFAVYHHGFGQDAYTTTKVTTNFMVDRLHRMYDGLVVLSLNPGWLDTDMGTQGAHWFGLVGPPQKVSEHAPMMIKTIEQATKDNFSGKMVAYDGEVQPW